MLFVCGDQFFFFGSLFLFLLFYWVFCRDNFHIHVSKWFPFCRNCLWMATRSLTNRRTRKEKNHFITQNVTINLGIDFCFSFAFFSWVRSSLKRYGCGVIEPISRFMCGKRKSNRFRQARVRASSFEIQFNQKTMDGIIKANNERRLDDDILSWMPKIVLNKSIHK